MKFFQQISDLIGNYVPKDKYFRVQFLNIMASLEEEWIYQQHPYVIIGAGISGLQAGIILAQHNMDFIILEASDKIGGRIGTEKLNDVLKQEFKREDDYPKWIGSNKKALNTPIEYGATWISQEHTFMLKILKEFKIRVFPQYYDGLSIYGREPGNYEEVRTLNQHYKDNENQIQGLLDKIEAIKAEFKEINNEIGLKKQTNERFNKFIDTYDTLSVKDFILGELKNELLANEILNEIQTLECMSGDKLSMMQLFEDDSSLELLKYYTGKAENTIDGMRVENGMITIPENMCKKMMNELKTHKPTVTEKQILRMSSPVIKIENQENKPSSKKVYICKNIFFSVPIAVINQIQITGISESKKIIFDNQESGAVNRVYLVFQHAFWRSKYSGYGSFNHTFPFNQLTELSPASLACGVLAFVFVGENYNKWVTANPNPQKRLEYLKGIIADLFLKGDKNSPYLENCFSYSRSYSDHPYIKAGYQATTKRQIWKKIKDKGQDYVEIYDRDDNNLIYIGSQFADEFSTFMEGAIRHSRMKVFRLLGIPDPWRN